jgi:hypothetical protein
MLQLLSGHGWLDLAGIAAVFAVAIGGFFIALPVLISAVDPDATGIPKRWPR